MIASAQYTIVDLNDPIQQGTAPSSPVSGMLWLDTSATPPMLKRYDGETWAEVGAGTDALDKLNQLAASSELVVGTQTTATSAWTGVCGLSALKDGQQLTYWLPTASASAAVTLSLIHI